MSSGTDHFIRNLDVAINPPSRRYSKLSSKQKKILGASVGLTTTVGPPMYSKYKKRKGDWKNGERHWTDNMW